tara:strand:+ start:11476 stop:12528 length:1053 start_codon:yes stop_codon:yes gene_type:complete
MQILFDLTPVYATRGGNHTYSKELYSALSKEKAVHLVPFAYKLRPSALSGILRIGNAAYRDLVYFPIAGRIASRDADIVHSTGAPIFPWVPEEKHVVTVHDLAILDTPERFTSWSKWYFERIFLPALNRCRAIVTNSEFTQGRLGALFPELVVKSSVTPLSAKDFSHVEAQPIEGFEEGFYLFVGSSDPAKNLKLVRESYQAVEASGESLPKTAVVGTFNFGVGDQRGADRNLVELGGVTDGELKWLYERCVAFLFPSYYEGFGLPILEAMSCGAPVICGEICSLPEVAGDAACYAELNADSYAAAMKRLYADLEYRAVLIELGRKRCDLFSWDRTADLTLRVYNSILKH